MSKDPGALWSVQTLSDGRVHILPIGDWYDHEVHWCACGPDVEAVREDDGQVTMVVAHHSLDGRAPHGLTDPG